MTHRGVAWAGALALLAACAAAGPRVVDLDGVAQDPRRVPRGRVHVLVFTSHECPIANAYAPTLRDLAAAWRDRPVDLFVVHVDPDLTAAQARAHAADHGLPGTILLDPGHDLARALGATRTPEAVVLLPGAVAYRGRIDDQWPSLGTRVPATRPDLDRAVDAALRGEATPGPHPPAVGCLLPEPRA